jgi:hypothetical protein
MNNTIGKLLALAGSEKYYLVSKESSIMEHNRGETIPAWIALFIKLFYKKREILHIKDNRNTQTKTD